MFRQRIECKKQKNLRNNVKAINGNKEKKMTLKWKKKLQERKKRLKE